ncbi:MAG TPA: acyltransferase [Polyangiaceae bacterium]|nr:acyltransferase [Polyangiaceae bacterium]
MDPTCAPGPRDATPWVAAKAGPAHRLPSLDGLRAISIALVLFGHLAGAGLPLFFGRGANLGVTVFFVISGYLITGLLIGEHERTGRISLRRFYARRTLRIFPAFYAFVAAVLLLKGLGLVTLAPGDLLAAVTYSMNYHYQRAWALGHVWSLAVEEQFYLLWPAALALLGLSRGAKAAVVVIAIGPIARTALYVFAPQSRVGLDQMFPTVSDTLATGCLLALAQRRLSASAVYRRFLLSPAFTLVPIGLLAAVALGDHPRFDGLFGQTLRNVAIALVLDRAVRFPRGAFGAFLNARPVAFVGTISYSLYLWQQPFVNRHASLWMNHPPQSVILAFATAFASYRLVERPVLAWRDRARREPLRVPDDAASARTVEAGQ